MILLIFQKNSPIFNIDKFSRKNNNASHRIQMNARIKQKLNSQNIVGCRFTLSLGNITYTHTYTNIHFNNILSMRNDKDYIYMILIPILNVKIEGNNIVI